MSLRIAFDLDGVLADMESELARQAEILFGEAMTRKLQERADRPTAPASDIPPTTCEETEAYAKRETAAAPSDNVLPRLNLNMTSRQERKLWRRVGSVDNFWETLEDCEPGVVARLAALASERRWEIIFLTKRPESAGATAQVQSQRWLEAKGFAHPSVYVVRGSRGRIAAALDLDLVIDDRPENCLDVVVDSKARAILVWRDDEKQLPAAARRLGIGVVRSVGECLDILTQIDDSGRDDAGMMTKLLRLLGLKDPATI